MDHRSQSGGIDRDEWLKALAEAGVYDEEHDEHAITIAEFAKMFGIARPTARDRLEQLVMAGKAERTRKWGVNARGWRVHFTAFRLTPKRKKP